MLEIVCLAWLLGTGTVSLLLWCGGFFFSGIVLQGMVSAGVLALGIAGWKRRGRFRLTFPWPSDPLEWLLAVIIALEIAAMVLVSLGQTLGWDGSFNWEVKARYAFLNHGVMPAAYFRSGSQAASHPEYPLLVPFTQLWLDLWMGQAHQFWEKAVIPIFNAAGVILLALLGARGTCRRWVGGLIAALLFFIPYLARGVGGVTSGYLDFPLGILYLAAIGYLLLYQETGDVTYFRFYAATLALLPWLKREGAILWLVAAACGAVVILRRKESWRSWAALLPGLLIMVGWQLYLKSVGAAPSHDFVAATPATLLSNFGRLWPICRTVCEEMAQTERWSIFWLLVAVAFLCQAYRKRDLRLLLLTGAVIAPIGLYSYTYVFSAWPEYLSHVHASIPRLLLQLTPLGWLNVAMGLKAPLRQKQTGESPFLEQMPNEEMVIELPLAARRPANS